MARLKTRDGIWLGVPLRTCVRIWRARLVNSAGVWLVDHGHSRAAVALWRIRL